MAKAVLISIRPEWVQKIVTDEKTVEIRKTRPNLGTPFKCYIYETQGKSDTPWIDEDGHMIFRGRGKILAEFTCDRINSITHVGYSGSGKKPVLRAYKADNPIELEPNFDFSATCMSTERIEQYLGGGGGYAWHISNLKIYDTPKELSKFSRPFENCIGKTCDEFGCALCENGGHIKRPPQSWCYVEELK
jgi:predicted transcriptional regulator|nr:MAG TPA: helix-turn-helix domain-containing protein [Caudoviricetes sp.]